jgi:eukaryotic-like serine/threonine-protein kinase
MVAGYPLRARLGSGGMGRVYLSFSPGGRALAIKVVRPEYAGDDEFRRRFQQEVAAAQRVQGLYTAPVVDADANAAVPWLATAYVPGPSLQQAVAEHGPLPLPTVFRLLAGVAEGLSAVHACGIVHRDLKPGNVLLADDGPRVIDFGIAHAADATTITHTGVQVGTPAFMAPEQIRGRSATPAVDVFALGNLAVFAATGRTAFGDGNQNAMLYRIINEPPDLAACPPALRTIVERCLAKEPGDRPGLAEIMTYARAQTSGDTLRLTGSWLPTAVVTSLAAYGTAAFARTAPPRPSPRQSPRPPTRTLPRDSTWRRPPAAASVPAAAHYPRYRRGRPRYRHRRGGGIGVLIGVAIAIVMIAHWMSNAAATGTDTGIGHAPNGFGIFTPPPAFQRSHSFGSPTLAPPPTVTTVPTTVATTQAFNPDSLNEAATDRTPQTATALLPAAFTDIMGRHFTRTAGGAESCVADDQTSQVRDILNQYRCVGATAGDFVSDDGAILVSVRVMGLANQQTALDAYGALRLTDVGDMGIDCPRTGTGAQLCTSPQALRQAAKEGQVGAHYRYLLGAIAVDTGPAPAFDAGAALTMAAQQALRSVGPQNYPGNQ